MDLDEFLEFVSTTDEFRLLAVQTKSVASSSTEHLITKFNEVNDFITANGREPDAASRDVIEFQLHQRLNSVRQSPEHCIQLSEVDVHGLLSSIQSPQTSNNEEPKELNSLDDIFLDDTMGILDDDAESIYVIKHVPQSRSSPEHVSRRKKCQDFQRFKPIFDKYHLGLKSGSLKRRKFQSELQIQTGELFVVDGVLVYIANIGDKEKKGFGNVNARLYCVFDNGTESNMYLRSLAAAMWKDDASGQIVEVNQSDIFDDNNPVTSDDEASGHIYILKSLSKDPKISSINDLYKIGYSTMPVEKRIANAVRDPTYLMAPVYCVASYECFNLNLQKFEQLLHAFFGEACLEVNITGLDKKMHRPREWFIVPLKIIETAVPLLINGEIINYQYDLDTGEIVKKD